MIPFYYEVELTLPKDVSPTERTVRLTVSHVTIPTWKSSPYTVGLFPDKQFGRDLSKGIPEGYVPKPYDYFSVPHMEKLGDYKLECPFPAKRGDPSRQEIEQWFRAHFSPDTTFSRLKVSATLYQYHAETGALERKWKCHKVGPSNLSSEESGLWTDLICEDMEALTGNFHPQPNVPPVEPKQAL